MKLSIVDVYGRDLYAEKVECTCLDPKWSDSTVARLFKTKISLSGYNDENFFVNVNQNPRQGECPCCKRKFTYQWLSDGVEFNWNDE